MMQEKELKSVRVLIVDDSAFTRQTIKRMLEKAPNIEIVGVATDGYDGMRKILKFKPDVITLDLEMPEMDGFTLLRWIMEESPMPVIVVSSHGESSTVFQALELGAVDFVVKPTQVASRELEQIEGDLLRKVMGVASLRMERIKKSIALLEHKGVISNFKPVEPGPKPDIEIVAIGASTGGPTAIQSIVSKFPGDFPAAMLISQHMPPGFTKEFAQRINKLSALTVKEAEDGEALEKGKVLICPGDHHVMLNRRKDGITVNLKKSSVTDIYIPSIDIMMRSVAQVYGARAMGIVLTGMGSDGKTGMKEIKARGGFTIAESEESAVIFGMPKEAILAGAVDKVLALEEIPVEILRRIRGLS